MKGIAIRDADPNRPFLSFDLTDLLDVVGADAVGSTWSVRGVECVGPSAEAVAALHKASDESEELSGERLVALAREITQVIDGEFIGRRLTESDPWIVIRAVDSSWFDVETTDEALLLKLRARFNEVSDLPD
jgi:hypothetical protein